MAGCAFKQVIVGNLYGSRSCLRYRNISTVILGLKTQGQPTFHSPIYGYVAAHGNFLNKRFSSPVLLGSKCFRSSLPSPCSSALSTAPSVSLSKENISVEKTLKLISGSCYLPHPDKVETGGEDAHFICKHEQAIGVADGVGGWAGVGVDAGHYSRKLMLSSASAIQCDHKNGSIDLVRALKKAHAETKVKGSSTACIVALINEGLCAINLGDSGFTVVRDGHKLFSSPVQLHGFNFPYQLANGKHSDLPSSGQVFKLNVAPGDVIVVGTDGLFDNLFNNEIIELVVDALRDGLSPNKTAQRIAASAQQVAQDKHHPETPFSIAAREAGFHWPTAGKLDDITVVVSYVTNASYACSKPELGKSTHLSGFLDRIKSVLKLFIAR
ncbi:probable protein phosphatase 2C 55 isoform X2 [Mercurialis annua]|uniref:probable protein phosphatase 2C 55 isoform X2 n=1 Tax=Mercurialis annua TaxID=3986 RepID=UPI00215E17BE|nr:probable protein phosphatase 2C 55 isoform X2 [Mercurialis annua]